MKINNKIVEMLKISETLLPDVEKNVGCVYESYTKGEISKGAFNYVLSREANICDAVEKCDFNNGTFVMDTCDIDVVEDAICSSITWMCHDLKEHIDLDLKDDVINSNRINEKIIRINELFDSIGYTATHPLFDIRIKQKI